MNIIRVQPVQIQHPVKLVHHLNIDPVRLQPVRAVLLNYKRLLDILDLVHDTLLRGLFDNVDHVELLHAHVE